MEHTIYASDTARTKARGLLHEGIDTVKSFFRMLRDPSYRFPRRLKILTVVCLIYFISPFDLVPDFIPLLGFADDVTMLVGTFTLWLNEITSYRKREI